MADTNEVCCLDIYLLLIIVLMCYQVKLHGKDFNENYLSRTCTTCINGVFALIIFYSHLIGYISVDLNTGGRMYAVREFLGQLMVASFLFYSGYGVYEQIKKNSAYVRSIPGNRAAKVWIRLMFSVCLFAAMLVMLGHRVDKKEFLLALIGWEHLGNGTWYVFAILVMYLLTYGAFMVCGDRHKLAIGLVFVGSVCYVLFMEGHKQTWWYDTVMCYSAGMVVSYYREGITARLFKNGWYILTCTIALLAFLILGQYLTSYWVYNLYAILFVLLVVLVSMKIEIRSPVLNWFGRNAFWMYVLQRIPMIVLQEIGFAEANPYKTAALSFAATVVGVFLCERLFVWVDRLLFGAGKKKVQTTQV